MFGQKRAIVTPTDDIVRPKRLCCMNLVTLEWLSTKHNAQRSFRAKKCPSRCRGWTIFQSRERHVSYAREGYGDGNAIQSPKLVDCGLIKDSSHLSSCQVTPVLCYPEPKISSLGSNKGFKTLK